MSISWVIRMIVIPRSMFSRLEDAHDLDAGAGVEVARRLVGQHDGRLVDERARDRHALLLPAGQLVGIVVIPLAETDAVERRHGAL